MKEKEPCPHCDDEGWVYWIGTEAEPDPTFFPELVPMPVAVEMRETCICKAGLVKRSIDDSEDLPF